MTRRKGNGRQKLQWPAAKHHLWRTNKLSNDRHSSADAYRIWAGFHITKMEANGGLTFHYTLWYVIFLTPLSVSWFSCRRLLHSTSRYKRTSGCVNEAWWLQRGLSNESKWEVREKKGPPSYPESFGEKWVAPPDGPPDKAGSAFRKSRCRETGLQYQRERRQQLSICHHTL